MPTEERHQCPFPSLGYILPYPVYGVPAEQNHSVRQRRSLGDSLSVPCPCKNPGSPLCTSPERQALPLSRCCSPMPSGQSLTSFAASTGPSLWLRIREQRGAEPCPAPGPAPSRCSHLTLAAAGPPPPHTAIPAPPQGLCTCCALHLPLLCCWGPGGGVGLA
jgi:hypothetical protein